MKIAVIGSTSLIARQFIQFLDQSKHEVILFGKEQNNETYFHFPESPINTHSLLTMDFILYFAGAGIQPQSTPTSKDLFGLNCFEPIRIMEELKDLDYKGHIISFGSYFEIGNSIEKISYNELDIVFSKNEVLNAYSESKRLLSRYLYDNLSKTSSYSFTHFYLPNIYSSQENPNRLIPYLIRSIKEESAISLSNGNQVRQYIHVKDVAQFLIKYISSPNLETSKLVNLSSDDEITVKIIVDEVITMAKKEGLKLPEITFGTVDRRDSKAQYLLLNDTFARKELGWKPKITISDGIKEYL